MKLNVIKTRLLRPAFAISCVMMNFVRLFIGALGRGDYSGHYAPITQVKCLMRGVYHGEIFVKDVREKSSCLDPCRSISEEMANGHIRSDILEVTSAANAEPGTLAARDRRER